MPESVKFNEEQRRLHKRLLVEITNKLDDTSSSYSGFRHQIRDAVGGSGVLGRCKNLFEIFDNLGRRKKLGILNYDTLKEAFRESDNEDIESLIEEYEQLIKDATDPVVPRAEVDSSQGASNTAPVRDKRAREEVSIESSKAPKLEKEESDPSDGKFFEEGRLSYYQTDRKTGYLLILNFEENRNYTEYDVQNLKNFFGEELRFEVNSPRDEWLDDFTTREVLDRLEFVRLVLSDDYNSKKYYCFICVILSHGKEGVFKTKDGQVKIDDIRKMFSNKNMQKFAGKPKVFFIQACQGGGVQGTVETNDESDDDEKERTPDIDESDQLIRIPNDADVLLAYATTPGYRAYRRRDEGSWFIKECISTFQEFYQRLDLENMMITVRERVALNWERMDRGKQMPYTWSTLTHRLRLRRSQI